MFEGLAWYKYYRSKIIVCRVWLTLHGAWPDDVITGVQSSKKQRSLLSLRTDLGPSRRVRTLWTP